MWDHQPFVAASHQLGPAVGPGGSREIWSSLPLFSFPFSSKPMALLVVSPQLEGISLPRQSIHIPLVSFAQKKMNYHICQLKTTSKPIDRTAGYCFQFHLPIVNVSVDFFRPTNPTAQHQVANTCQNQCPIRAAVRIVASGFARAALFLRLRPRKPNTPNQLQSTIHLCCDNQQSTRLQAAHTKNVIE